MLRLLILACALSAINAYYISASECGKPANPPKQMSINIVGGEPAEPNTWPWMVEVLKDDSHHCGATLISENWIVSAAHCFERNPNLNRYKFSLGGHEEADLTEATRQTFQASMIIRHEEFSTFTMSHDVALIKIDEGVVLNDAVSTACLAIDHPDAGAVGYVTGWGNQEKIIQDKTLHQVNVPIRTHQECEDAYPGEIDHTMICAGYDLGRKDSCQGDSGGPLVVETDGVWTLTGIVSWGYGCADPGQYGVYADIDHLLDWIETTMANN